MPADPDHARQMASVLIPGRTCWRVARANRFAVIIDAADYFRHLRTAILSARHSILIIGWDFDPRTELDRRGEGPDDGAPNAIGALLEYVLHRSPHLRIRVLRWDLAFLKMPVRGTTSALILDWLTPGRLKFRMDGHHPPGACHHQKIAVIDDCMAFCGGIDVTGGRWDTPAHLDDDPGRRWPNDEPHGPWHDATTAVDGPAARALGELARARWAAATGHRPHTHPPGGDCWPADLLPDLRDVDIGIARTEPPYRGRPPVREIEALYLAAIASARRFIYLESQYFAAHGLSDAVKARLAEADGPEIVIINPIRADGWLEEQAMGSARALLLAELRAADTHGRLRFLTPVTAGGADIYVHAKILVIDDRLLRVGSSNINNRSLGLDTECDIAVELPGGEADDAVAGVVDRLLAEHLGVDLAVVQAARRDNDGSIVQTVDLLMRPSGKTLVRFEPPQLTDAQRTLAEERLLDPDWPEPMVQMAARAVTRIPGVRAAALAAAGLAGAAAWLIVRRLTRPRAAPM